MKSPSQSDPWIGRLLSDGQRYRLDKRIAVGGMREIFLATDTLLDKQVALKLLKDTPVESEELRKRFEREVELCVALKSDHIVEVSDYGVTAEGYPFFVMEYLRGQSLDQLLRQKQRLPLERTVNLVAQVCDGLQFAHTGVTLRRDNATVSEQIKVVHRGLKPTNIFLVPIAVGELVKILDFGVAKIREAQAERTNLTNTFLKAYHYAAPEQLEVEKDLDGRADIYSLGIIVYEMLSGTDPFGLGLNTRKISGMSWAIAHASKPAIPLRSQPGLSQLPLELEMVVMRCLQKTPNERFASVDELKRALQAAISVGGGAIAQTAPPRAEVPEATVAQTAPPRAEVPEATVVQTAPPLRAEVPEATIAQTAPPRAEVPEATIAQTAPPRAEVPEATIAQTAPPPRAKVPEATIAQTAPPPRAKVPEATIAQTAPPPHAGVPEATIAQTALPRAKVPGVTIAQTVPPRAEVPDETITQNALLGVPVVLQKLFGRIAAILKIGKRQ